MTFLLDFESILVFFTGVASTSEDIGDDDGDEALEAFVDFDFEPLVFEFFEIGFFLEVSRFFEGEFFFTDVVRLVLLLCVLLVLRVFLFALVSSEIFSVGERFFVVDFESIAQHFAQIV